MSSFVSVNTVYSNFSDRNVKFLSNIYQDKDVLYTTVKSLITSHFSDADIRNKKILLKPNWVRHNLKENDKICLRTDDNFLLATLTVVLEYSPKSVIIADAPIQGCDWDKMLSQYFINEVDKLSQKHNIEIKIKDFRRTKFNQHNNIVKKGVKALDDYIIFDVGKDSFLEPITTEKNKFRVTCYNPDKLAEAHHKGMHKYCIAKDVFDCDVIITVPKIKTHQKSGLTNSLKILVGINGDKDYLPHHRIGAKGHGGDCYKGYNPLRRASELILDEANRHIGGTLYKPLNHLSSLLWKLTFPKLEQNLAAGWYGNDTVWRMVLDLNKIAIYGKKDGIISETPQRKLFTLCDGIIGGQGNGPLDPTPLALGVVAFSDNPYLMDIIAGRLFKLNIDRIPLLREAKSFIKDDYVVKINNKISNISEIDKYSVDVLMPPGWIKYNVK